jgi:DNA polymerase III epsilon subunit-like protein
MNTDIMIDLETLDTKPTASILTIGAVKFDPFGDDLNSKKCEKLYIKVDLDSCDRIGLTTSEDTIAWWSQQSKEAQEEAFSTEGRIPIHEAMNQLYKFCWGAQRVWSHGAAFDIVICEHVFAKLQKLCPWNFWQVRCTRTLFDIGINPHRPPVLQHHALEDAWNQAVGVQNVMRTLRTSSRINGELIQPYANMR